MVTSALTLLPDEIAASESACAELVWPSLEDTLLSSAGYGLDQDATPVWVARPDAQGNPRVASRSTSPPTSISSTVTG